MGAPRRLLARAFIAALLLVALGGGTANAGTPRWRPQLLTPVDPGYPQLLTPVDPGYPQLVQATPVDPGYLN